jgi:hypothetical protein
MNPLGKFLYPIEQWSMEQAKKAEPGQPKLMKKVLILKPEGLLLTRMASGLPPIIPEALAC